MEVWEGGKGRKYIKIPSFRVQILKNDIIKGYKH